MFFCFRKSHLLCLALLTLGFTFTYSTNMILAEVFFDRLGGLLPFVLVNSHGHSNTTNNCFRSQLAFSENPFILTHMQAILSNHPLNHHQNVFIKMFIINVNKKSSGEILSRHNPPPPLTSRHIHQVQKHKSDPKNFCPFVSNMKNLSFLILEYCIYLLSLTRRVSSNLNKLEKMVFDRSTLAPQLS